MSQLPTPRLHPDVKKKQQKYKTFLEKEEQLNAQRTQNAFQCVDLFMGLLYQRIPTLGLRIMWKIDYSTGNDSTVDKSAILMYAMDRNQEVNNSYPKIFASVELKPSLKPIVFVNGRNKCHHRWADQEVEALEDVIKLLTEIDLYTSNPAYNDVAYFIEAALEDVEQALAVSDNPTEEEYIPAPLSIQVAAPAAEASDTEDELTGERVEVQSDDVETSGGVHSGELSNSSKTKDLSATYDKNRNAVFAAAQRRKPAKRQAVPARDQTVLKYLAETLRNLTAHPNGRRFSPHLLAYAAALHYKSESAYLMMLRSHTGRCQIQSFLSQRPRKELRSSDR